MNEQRKQEESIEKLLEKAREEAREEAEKETREEIKSKVDRFMKGFEKALERDNAERLRSRRPAVSGAEVMAVLRFNLDNHIKPYRREADS